MYSSELGMNSEIKILVRFDPVDVELVVPAFACIKPTYSPLRTYLSKIDFPADLFTLRQASTDGRCEYFDFTSGRYSTDT